MAVTKEQPTVKAQVFFPSPDRNEGGRTGGHKAKRIYEYEVREALLGRRGGDEGRGGGRTDGCGLQDGAEMRRKLLNV